MCLPCRRRRCHCVCSAGAQQRVPGPLQLTDQALPAPEDLCLCRLERFQLFAQSPPLGCSLRALIHHGHQGLFREMGGSSRVLCKVSKSINLDTIARRTAHEHMLVREEQYRAAGGGKAGFIPVMRRKPLFTYSIQASLPTPAQNGHFGCLHLRMAHAGMQEICNTVHRLFQRGSRSQRCLVRYNIAEDVPFLCEISAAGLNLASVCSGSNSLRFLALALPKGNRELAVR